MDDGDDCMDWGEPDCDDLEFRLSRSASGEGVPLALMRAPTDGTACPSRRPPRFGRPPGTAGLCAGARGLARQTPTGDDFLLWYRSHGTEGAVRVTAWLRLRLGSICEPWQAHVIVRAAMDVVSRGRTRRVRLGNGWRPPYSPKDAVMRARRFYDLRDHLAYWLASEIDRAQSVYWDAVSSAESETPASRYNGSREVKFPSGPRVFLRKRCEPLELQAAA